MKNECPVYLAYRLSHACRLRLIAHVRPKFDILACTHVTLHYPTGDVTQSELELERIKFMYETPVGSVVVNGYAEGFRIECLSVSVAGVHTRIDGSFYHVTVSHDVGRNPVESNQLRDRIKLMPNIILDGTFELLRK